MMQENKAFENWTKYYRSHGETDQLMWPSESVIHLMMGFLPQEGYDDKSILDVGFGNGNNFPFYLSKNMKVFGVEVAEEICDLVTQNFAHLGQSVDLRVGTNTNIPFDENSFDLLMSINVIHYENNKEDIIKAISKYASVLKKGARFIISTTGPQHCILEGSKKVGNHLYCINKDGEFRSGEVFFYFDSESEIRRYFEPSFDNIFIGRELKHLPKGTVDYFLISGIKK